MVDVLKFQGRWAAFSNFWCCKGIAVPAAPGIDEVIELPTVEHAYVAAKAGDTWLDFALAANVGPPQYRAMTAGQAKRLGRRIPLREDWEGVKVPVMRDLLQQKFGDRNPELVKLLLSTGGRIVEGNWWHDQFYGDCWCNKCSKPGLNWLGRLLMERREELRGG